MGAQARSHAVGSLGLAFALGACAHVAPQRAPRAIPGAAAAYRRSEHKLPARGDERLDYAVTLDGALRSLSVEVCPRGFRIERLESPSTGAQELLRGDHIITPEGEYACPADGVDLPLTKADECVRYVADFPEKTPDPTMLRRVGDDVLATPDLWLWVPTPRPARLTTHVRFALPPGVTAAMPWPRAGADFTLPETAFTWKAGGAFTHAEPHTLRVANADLVWAPLGQGFEQPADLVAWLEQGASAAASLFGHFPLQNALVLGVPGERGRAPFGMALRGGGPTVEIFLDRFANAKSLASDWTATHEFLHLAVPRLPPEDAWLFEGLATYYTELVRARTGAITARAAFQHLQAGFERGKKHATERTLRESSAKMRANRDFYRVYWSGAALAFLTDVAARKTHGPTLDDALRELATCCASSQEAWTAERVLARLDQTLGAPRFTELAHAALDRAEFPRVEPVLRELGVVPGARDEAEFVAAPGAPIRDALVAPLQPEAEREPKRQ